MPTTVVGTIGSGKTFATPQAWITSLNGLDLVAGNTIQQGQVFSGAEFTAAGAVADFSAISVTTGAANYMELTTATGQSFRDQAGVRTNALYYNAANGVALRNTGSSGYTVNTGTYFVHLSNLQLQANSGSSGALNTGNGGTVVVNNCIISGAEESFLDAGTSTFNNCLIVTTAAAFNRGFVNLGNNATFNFCTFVAPTGSSLANMVDYGNTGTPTVLFNSNAFFGFNTALATRATGPTITYASCMTDLASQTGVTGSEVFANQFVSTTNDFRTKAGANLINAGTPVSGITTDISGTTRSVTTPTVGVWEFAAAGPTRGKGGLLLFGIGSVDMIGAAALWKAGEAIRRNATLSRRSLLTGGK